MYPLPQDIADGYTGLTIVVSDTACTSSPCVEVAGGTSLATPVFSGKWTLLNQLNGVSLGQAAPLIARYADTPAVEDIVPHPQGAVTGATNSSSGMKTFSAKYLANPETNQPFVSTIWQVGEGTDLILSFGTDSSLAVTPGYDSATGWGQLNVAAIFAGVLKSAVQP